MTGARDLVSAECDATAVFIASDIQTVGAMRELRASGYTIPGDLAVMGFDGTSEGAYSWPSLSTVRQPLDVIVETAFAMRTGDRQSAHHVVEHNGPCADLLRLPHEHRGLSTGASPPTRKRYAATSPPVERACACRNRLSSRAETHRGGSIRPTFACVRRRPAASHVDHPLTTTPEALPPRREKGPLTWYFTCSGGGI